MKPENTVFGIVGAGTMGSGIALAALYKGYRVILQDAFPGAIENAQAYIKKFLTKKDLSKNLKLATFTETLEDLAPADVVVEAVIEDLNVKKELFEKLDEVCPPPAILATNTSTLPVTAIAAATQTPERVGGMHFFNPAPVLPLVEVVRGSQSSQTTIDILVELAESLGKTPVVTGDTPGFIVNRVARPFYGEALRLLGEGVASHEEIDQLVEKGAGFRMGPFRLMDLIGIDINATAMKSMYEQTFGEPRYRPHWIQMQKMQAGTLGSKTGRGFYEYGGQEEREEAEVTKVEAAGSMIVSEGSWGPGLEELGAKAGYSVDKAVDDEATSCFIVAGRDEGLEQLVDLYDNTLPIEIPMMVQSVDVSLSEILSWAKNPQRIVGFDGLFFAGGDVITLEAHMELDQKIADKMNQFAYSLGKQPVWIKESPGLILPRIVFMLTNEAAFAELEGVADGETIDLAMKLGVNYPKGPLAWGQEFSLDKVVKVLDHLRDEYGEDRYRACVRLRQQARTDKSLR